MRRRSSPSRTTRSMPARRDRAPGRNKRGRFRRGACPGAREPRAAASCERAAERPCSARSALASRLAAAAAAREQSPRHAAGSVHRVRSPRRRLVTWLAELGLAGHGCGNRGPRRTWPPPDLFAAGEGAMPMRSQWRLAGCRVEARVGGAPCCFQAAATAVLGRARHGQQWRALPPRQLPVCSGLFAWMGCGCCESFCDPSIHQ